MSEQNGFSWCLVFWAARYYAVMKLKWTHLINTESMLFTPGGISFSRSHYESFHKYYSHIVYRVTDSRLIRRLLRLLSVWRCDTEAQERWRMAASWRPHHLLRRRSPTGRRHLSNIGAWWMSLFTDIPFIRFRFWGDFLLRFLHSHSLLFHAARIMTSSPIYFKPSMISYRQYQSKYIDFIILFCEY